MRSNPTLYKLFLNATAKLPLPLARKIGCRLGRLYYRLAKRHVHIARVNMGICYPELSPAEREARVRESFCQAGAWIMEAGAVWTWPPEKILSHVRVINPEIFQRALTARKGVILAIPHLGNWEILGPYITARHDFACFYRPNEKKPAISEFIRQLRSRRGTVMASTDTRGIRLLYKHLKDGGVVGLLPDHNPTEQMGVFAPFFGRPALTGTLISSLARKQGAPVLTAAVIRTDDGFDIHFAEVSNQHSDNPELAAASLNKAIEACIALAPAQFQWVYPRFRKRPDPERTPSPYR